jgi:hypothetical protein
MERNVDKAFRSHNVFDTEAHLMGISWPGAHRGRSWASEDFIPDESMKRVAGGVLIPAGPVEKLKAQ